MMQSPFLSVRTKATHLVGQFCQTNAIFDFMVTNGTIDKLTAINKSSHLKTALSEETQRSILEYNYPSKFAHFDKLNNTEKIDHLTFYECGTDSFDTLEVRVLFGLGIRQQFSGNLLKPAASILKIEEP